MFNKIRPDNILFIWMSNTILHTHELCFSICTYVCVNGSYVSSKYVWWFHLFNTKTKILNRFHVHKCAQKKRSDFYNCLLFLSKSNQFSHVALVITSYTRFKKINSELFVMFYIYILQLSSNTPTIYRHWINLFAESMNVENPKQKKKPSKNINSDRKLEFIIKNANDAHGTVYYTHTLHDKLYRCHDSGETFRRPLLSIRHVITFIKFSSND